MKSPRIALFTAVGLSFTVFIVYWITAAPGAWWGDGLELAAAAKVLGVPHPTGYPLYMLIGHTAMRLFGFAEAGRVLTLISALLCAITVCLFGLACWRFLRRGPIEAEFEFQGRQVTLTVAGMVGLGFSFTIWDHATFAEVYPLTWLFMGAVLLLVISGEETPGYGRVAGLGVLCGLSLLNHYSILAFAPLAVFAVIQWGRDSKRVFRYLSLFVAVTVVFLLGYLYLPLRANANPPLNWGNPRSLAGILWMLRGGDYVAMNVPDSAGALLQGWGYWIDWWRRQFGSEVLFSTRALPAVIVALAAGPTILALGVAGCIRVLRRDWALGAGLLAAIVITLLFSVFYPIADRDAYLVPAIPAVLIGCLEWGKYLLEKISAASTRVGPKLWPAIPLLFALILIPLQFRSINKSWDDGPEVWAKNLLGELPPDSLILTRQAHDSEIYALWYEQIVKGARPDVTVFGMGFIFSGWYQKYFEAEGRPEVPLFITDRKPGAKEIFDIALIGGVIAPNAPHRRIFMTVSRSEEIDPVLRQLNPIPVATLLPDGYYDRSAYRFNPAGRLLVELKPDERILELYTEKFREVFEREPPE
jgi:hypothetical protein